MQWFMLQEIELLPEHERVLQDTHVDEDGPGTVLHDFEAVLAFLRSEDLLVTPGHQLPRRVLPEINARLAQPLWLGLKRPTQKSYPHINGLYLLARASGLARIVGTAAQPLLAVDDAVYRGWEALNPTERYFTLLEAWLLRGHPEIIGEEGQRWYGLPETFGHCSRLIQRIPDAGMEVGSDEQTERDLRYRPGWHNLGLMELFGLVAVQHGPPEQGRGWCIQRIHRTPLGDALVSLLHVRFFDDLDRVRQFRDVPEAPSGALQPVLRPYFPQWRTVLPTPGREPPVDPGAQRQEPGESPRPERDRQWLDLLVEGRPVSEAREADMRAEADQLADIIRSSTDETE